MNNSTLHYAILKFIIDNGFAPTVKELADIIGENQNNIKNSLKLLEENHGVVLHPNSYKIWVIHPFSLAPTNFLVSSGNKEYWGNCAWCSLGVAALLKSDCKIISTIGAERKQIVVDIRNGEIKQENLFIHFPVPMSNAWDNVIYTCSTMLLFENEEQIEKWCIKHRIPKGDVQPINKIWEFSKVWYGNHLNPDWEKWTSQEAKEIFNKFGLTNEIWNIPVTKEKF